MLSPTRVFWAGFLEVIVEVFSEVFLEIGGSTMGNSEGSKIHQRIECFRPTVFAMILARLMIFRV